MKQKKLPYFPLYPSDFLGDTGRLNAEKFGVYVRLLYNSWIEPLDNDIDELVEMVHSDIETTEKVLNRYFELVDGVWENPRLERERVKATLQHSKRVEAGRKGGNAKAMLDQSYPNDTSPALATQNSEPKEQRIELKAQNLELIRNIVSYLNSKLGSSFKHQTPATQTAIRARLNDGFTGDDIKTVIDSRVSAWKDDPKMAQYLRPLTLFGTKFESYLQSALHPVDQEPVDKLKQTTIKDLQR